MFFDQLMVQSEYFVLIKQQVPRKTYEPTSFQILANVCRIAEIKTKSTFLRTN
jgi:hypothetical protein